MAILGKIREKSIVLILVIGMALFAFVISGVFDGAMQQPKSQLRLLVMKKSISNNLADVSMR